MLMLRVTVLGLERVGEREREGSTAPTISVGTIVAVAAEVADSTGIVAEGAQTAASPLASELPVSPLQDGQGAADAQATEAAGPAAAKPAVAIVSAAPVRATRQDSLRQAAQALLDAWNKLAERDHDIVNAMSGPVAGLRAALTTGASTSASTGGSAQPRDTKHAQVLAMLGRDEGASGPQIAEAMGWAPHTVRGFLAGLAKKGINVEVLERVRQVGPNKVGASGSYTVYRLMGTAGE